jgi:Lecithin:cholesterol acyltransferase
MKNHLIKSLSSMLLLVLFAVLITTNAFSQRIFDVREILKPPGSSSFQVDSFNDNGEIVGYASFRRCVAGGGGGGDIGTKNIKDDSIGTSVKLDEECFDEIKPVYWSPTGQSTVLSIPNTTNPSNRILGKAFSINNSGVIAGHILKQDTYNTISGVSNEYTNAAIWNSPTSVSTWLPAPPAANIYMPNVCLKSGINNNGQFLAVRYDQRANGFVNECIYTYGDEVRHFIPGESWITPLYNPTRPFSSWRAISNLNDRGEVIFFHRDEQGNNNNFDILLYSSGVMHSIKSQLENPNDSADYIYQLANNGDIFYRESYVGQKKFWIRNPLENNPGNRIELDMENFSPNFFNDSELFTGNDLLLKKGVLWNEVSGKIDIAAPENSGWTNLLVGFINNKGQILGSATKNGVEKQVLLTPRPPPPLIFVPGTMGSELYLKSDHQKYWISPFTGTLIYNNYMTLDSSSGYYLGDDAFSAKDALRKIAVPIPSTDDVIIYDTLIENLKQYGGYKEYNLYPSVWGIPTPDEGGCDTSQINLSDPSKNPTLFVFPYDFRKDNALSAEKLATFVNCVQQFHPNTPINLLGHSQGGLVSRRYIIDNPNDHGIEKLITIATPYLGAPEAIYKMERGGSWKGDGWGDFKTIGFNVAAITPNQIKFLSKHFKSVHQLLPSRAYFEINGERFGLTEIGDVDGNGIPDEIYDYDKFVNFMNNDFSTNPGTTGKTFHDCLPENMTKCQDDWRQDTSGIQYTHIIGQQLRNTTTISVGVKNEIAIVAPIGTGIHTIQRVFEPTKGLGDGTVPEISASRTNYDGLDFNLPGTSLLTFYSDRENLDHTYEHNGLTQNKQVIRYVLFKLGLTRDPEQLINQVSTAKNKQFSIGKVVTGNSYLPVLIESNYTKIIGISDAEISDDQGNKTSRNGDIFINKVEGLDYEIIGDNALFLTFPTTKSYFAKFQALNTPFSLDIVRGISNKTPNSAVRYKDVSLPQGTSVQLKVTALNEVLLKYDSNGDGDFDTVIPPTAIATGTSASDTTPPKVNIQTTMLGTQATISITANDAETGVKQIMYSINGQGFNIYTSPITLNTLAPTTVLAVADNNVGIRSGIYTKNILIPTAANSSISGRVTNLRGSARTVITLTRATTGESVSVRPNQIGYYRFENLVSGEDYILTPSRKGYRFEPQNRLVSLNEDLDNIDFQAILGGQ